MITTTKTRSFGRTLLVAGSALAIVGCVYRRDVVYEDSPPRTVVSSEVVIVEPPPMPAPVVEVVTVSPGPGYFWIDGCYEWAGARWVWYRGHWARPAHPGAVWVRGDWRHERGGKVWVSGHWR